MNQSKTIRIFSTTQDHYLEDFKIQAKELGYKILVYRYENFSFENDKLIYRGRKSFPEFTADDVIMFRRCAYEKTRQHFWVRLLATLAKDAGARVLNAEFMVNFPLHSGKLFQAAYFSAKKIPHVPTYRLGRKLKDSQFPMIVKKRYAAFGKDSHVVNTPEDLLEVKANIKNKDAFIVQRFFPLKSDTRVMILDNKILNAVSRSVTIHADRHVGVKVDHQKQLTPIELEIVNKVLQTFDLDIAGLDLFTDHNDRTWLGEMNFFPNFSSFMRETNLNVFELIFKMMVS